jgi:hypothetical protein
VQDAGITIRNQNVRKIIEVELRADLNIVAHELGALAKCPLRVALFFQPSWALRGGSQYFAPHANDFDALLGFELPPDGGPSQVGLSM